jgi:hypothetical protein
LACRAGGAAAVVGAVPAAAGSAVGDGAVFAGFSSMMQPVAAKRKTPDATKTGSFMCRTLLTYPSGRGQSPPAERKPECYPEFGMLTSPVDSVSSGGDE